MADPSESPKVSVVLPTYNRAHLLARAIRSVLNQSHRDLELIVVDDGSTDGTEQLVRSIEDPRLRYVPRENGGAAAARNTGIEAAVGEFVAFQDSDDEWLDGKLERQVDVLSSGDESVVLCLCSYLINIEGERRSVHRIGAGQLVRHGDLRHQTLQNFFFPTPTWLARRNALIRAKLFDPGLGCWEDWELAIRLSGLGEFVLVDDPLHLQHFKRSGVNSNERARMESMSRILEIHGPRWTEHPHALAEHHYTVARLACIHGTLAETRHHLRCALAANPRHRNAWAGLVLTTLGTRPFRELLEWRRATRRRRRPQPDKPLGPRSLN